MDETDDDTLYRVVRDAFEQDQSERASEHEQRVGAEPKRGFPLAEANDEIARLQRSVRDLERDARRFEQERKRNREIERDFMDLAPLVDWTCLLFFGGVWLAAALWLTDDESPHGWWGWLLVTAGILLVGWAISMGCVLVALTLSQLPKLPHLLSITRWRRFQEWRWTTPTRFPPSRD